MKDWFNQLLGRKPKPKSVTYFTHIPKTAGTSFIVLLDRFFHADHIFPEQLWREVGEVDQDHNQTYRLFRGHFGGGGVKALTQAPIEYLTILRHPHELAHSTFQFVKRERNTVAHRLVHDQDMSFKDFLAHPQTKSLVENRMVRNLSFDFVEDAAAQEVFLSAETIEAIEPMLSQSKPELTDQDRLQRANQFIRNCEWVGLLERFDESLQLLSYCMAWPPFGQTQKLNVNQQQTELDAEARALLHEVNVEDLALYQAAEKHFDVAYAGMLQALEVHRAAAEQSTDDLLDLHYQKHRKSSPVSGLDYRFDQPLYGGGWHRREIMQPENEAFRWTGPEATAWIDFGLKTQDYTLSMRIINALSPSHLDDLLLSINDQTLSWHSEDEGVVRVIKADVPAAMIGPDGFVRLAISLSERRRHAEVFESDDERLVGVAVHWIQFST